jgi:hypothetical protein
MVTPGRRSPDCAKVALAHAATTPHAAARVNRDRGCSFDAIAQHSSTMAGKTGQEGGWSRAHPAQGTREDLLADASLRKY